MLTMLQYILQKSEWIQYKTQHINNVCFVSNSYDVEMGECLPIMATYKNVSNKQLQWLMISYCVSFPFRICF